MTEYEEKQGEQDDKLKELEDKLEEAWDRIKELEDDVLEGDDAQDFIEITSSNDTFTVHWINASTECTGTCDTINTVKKAQEAFAQADAYRNANGQIIKHGDVLVLLCNSATGSGTGTRDDNCYYVGLCAYTDTISQVEAPASPDITKDSGRKEFLAWYTCPNCPTCPSSISALGASSTWTVSLGNCTKFDELMSVSAESDSEGTTLTFKKREFSINSCGEVINISAETSFDIEIPCCGSVWDEPCATDAYSYSNTYTVAWTDPVYGAQTQVVTRTTHTDIWGCWYWSGTTSGMTVTLSLNASQLGPRVDFLWDAFGTGVGTVQCTDTHGWTWSSGDNLTGAYRDNATASGPYDCTVS